MLLYPFLSTCGSALKINWRIIEGVEWQPPLLLTSLRSFAGVGKRSAADDIFGSHSVTHQFRPTPKTANPEALIGTSGFKVFVRMRRFTLPQQPELQQQEQQLLHHRRHGGYGEFCRPSYRRLCCTLR